MKLLECVMFGMLACVITGAGCERTEVLAAAGSQAVLPCACRSSTCPNPLILWTKGTHNKQTVWKRSGSGLEHFGSRWIKKNTPRVRCPHYRFLRGDFSLQINNVTEVDGGLYTCQVERGNQLVQSEVMLRIIKVVVNSRFPISGNLVLASCSVTPKLDRASVEWKLNNSSFGPQNVLTPDGEWGFVKENATMNLTGNWTCVVRNDAAEGRASTSISVRGIIHPSRDDSRLYAAVGSAATLPCVFSPGLEPSDSRWEKLKEGTPVHPAVDRLPLSLLSPSSSPTHLPGDKSATLGEVTSEDEGVYRCSGTVTGQSLARTVQLVVAKIVPVRRGSSVALTCHLSDASGVTDYEWVHVTYDHNGTESVDVIQKGETLSIGEESTEDGGGGEWTCRFYGEEGILGNVTYPAALMSGLSGEKSSSSSTKATAIFLISVLLLVLLLILAQMYKNYQRRKRVFQFPALETIVHTVSNEQEERERNRQKK